MASPALQEVLWGEDRPVLRLAGRVHTDAHSRLCGRGHRLPLRMRHRRRKHPQVGGPRPYEGAAPLGLGPPPAPSRTLRPPDTAHGATRRQDRTRCKGLNWPPKAGHRFGAPRRRFIVERRQSKHLAPFRPLKFCFFFFPSHFQSRCDQKMHCCPVRSGSEAEMCADLGGGVSLHEAPLVARPVGSVTGTGEPGL